jgi:DNA invertase Pin-like site-specific DNA recombinase
MNMNSSNIIKRKNIAIVYCRVSRVADESRGVLSLDSQEFAIKAFLETKNMGVHSVLKNTGSAFNKPQTELKNLLKSCKGKTVVVFEPNRLSRNLENFKEIYKICKKNKHDIAIVNMNTVFDHRISSNYEILVKLIAAAQKESADMGARISRTARYNKSRRPEWGNMRDDRDNIVPNKIERAITRLIMLLSTRGSSIAEIKTMVNTVGKMEGKEPFEIEEYDRSGRTDLENDKLPYPMSPSNIAETFKIYEIKKRRANWTSQDIKDILTKPVRQDTVDEDDLVNVFNSSFVERPTVPVVPADIPQSSTQEWVYIWYDPVIGLPPTVRIPEGMVLPSVACNISFPVYK